VKRTAIIALVGSTAVALLVYWVATNTEWMEAKLPMPLRGDARTNPFYAAQRLTAALRARATRDRLFTPPSPDAVIVLSAWNWNLSTARRDALQRWVESGGRLVLDRTLSGDDRDFERWSTISHRYQKRAGPADRDEETCRRFTEERDGAPIDGSPAAGYSLCDVDWNLSLTSTQTPRWALRDASGVQALRVAVGRGSVTMVNADPFRYASLLSGDHGAVFAAAAQLRSGDEVHFLSEDDYPSLLSLVWEYGAPVVALSLALVALGLWRRAVRFGPLAAPEGLSRRSLREQIRGSGRFALRHGGEALHAACLRALDEAAQRRIVGYTQLDARARTESLADLTGVGRVALAAAVDAASARRANDLLRAIALLETARRRVIADQKRVSHGAR
jgi:hypothetical protein